jgi:hypothetical protein
LLSITGIVGCVTDSARLRTVNQADTYIDLQYRAVMCNLAMIAHDPCLLPSYSVVNFGSVDVTDSVSMFGDRVLTKAPFVTDLDINASRGSKQNWTSEPVVAPEKLRAIRLACWYVLYPQSFPDNGDPNSDPPTPDPNDVNVKDGTVWLMAYGDGTTPERPFNKPGYYFSVLKNLKALRHAHGHWLHMGCNKDVPRCARYRAEYRGTVVGVCAEDMEALSEFMLVIQRICLQTVPNVYRPTPQDFTYSARVKVNYWRYMDANPNSEPIVCTQPDQIAAVTLRVDPFGNIGAVKNRLEGGNYGDQKLKSSLSASGGKLP